MRKIGVKLVIGPNKTHNLLNLPNILNIPYPIPPKIAIIFSFLKIEIEKCQQAVRRNVEIKIRINNIAIDKLGLNNNPKITKIIKKTYNTIEISFKFSLK